MKLDNWIDKSFERKYDIGWFSKQTEFGTFEIIYEINKGWEVYFDPKNEDDCLNMDFRIPHYKSYEDAVKAAEEHFTWLYKHYHNEYIN